MSLVVKDLEFRYINGGKKILDGFSAEFSAKEITAITGPNGTGKTTLSKLIMGILKPDKGEILLDGVNLKSWSLAERGRKIGYVMQNPAKQIFSQTVEEEMRFGLQNLGLSESEIRQRTCEYLSFFQLEEHLGAFPFTLSHGEKQRLVLAAILAMKPQYLLLDEPTASLDRKNKKRLGEYLKKTDCGIVIISHDKMFLSEYSEHVIEMERCYE